MEELRLATGEQVRDARKEPNIPQEFLITALGKISGGVAFIRSEVDLGMVVGKTNCVPVFDDDVFVEAWRPGGRRSQRTRFVIGRSPELTSLVTVLLQQDGHKYVLLASYFGRAAPPEPGDEDAFMRDSPFNAAAAQALAVGFWDKHALLAGTLPVLCTVCERIPIQKHDVVSSYRDGQFVCQLCQKSKRSSPQPQ